MRGSRALLLGIASAAAVSGGVYALVVRPRIDRWGATDEETTKLLPSDIADPAWPASVRSLIEGRIVSTRAVTIDVPPDEVWPWLVQIGCGRAGFYSHDWVERLFGMTYAEGHSATRIHPEFQGLRVGDRIGYSPFNSFPVRAMDRPRSFYAGEWFVLEPLDGGSRTRLIVRTRGGWLEPFAREVPVVGPLLWPVAAFIDRVPGEVLHHYMESGMLLGIKARAERSHDRAGQRVAA
jgi:hypothetical protein